MRRNTVKVRVSPHAGVKHATEVNKNQSDNSQTN